MKYIGSPWGTIRGKLNGAVGGVWKGINWGRVLVLPTQRGTLKKYRAYKDGKIPVFSFAQMNIRRAVIQVLGYIGRIHTTNFIIPIWQEFATRHNYKMTGLNVFVNRNAAAMFASMPNKDQEYIAATNAPDLTSMKMSDGDLEGTPILTATYATGSGATIITWAKDCFGNGLQTDKAWVCVLKKPILESVGRNGTWAPKLYLFGPYDTSVARSVETVTVTLPTGLSPDDLTAFLFFRDVAETLGFSVSNSHTVVAPA